MPEARFGQIEAKAAAAMMPHRTGEKAMAKLTMREARATIRATGLRIKSTGWDDYRVYWPEDAKQTERGYFTTDLEDAIDTAKAMAAERAAKADPTAARSLADLGPGPI
jgi:hypothetical protein